MFFFFFSIYDFTRLLFFQKDENFVLNVCFTVYIRYINIPLQKLSFIFSFSDLIKNIVIFLNKSLLYMGFSFSVSSGDLILPGYNEYYRIYARQGSGFKLTSWNFWIFFLSHFDERIHPFFPPLILLIFFLTFFIFKKDN